MTKKINLFNSGKPKSISLSGAIGVTKLIRGNKKITIFSDNHEKDDYCTENYFNNENISNYINKKKFNSQILLEEVERSPGIKLIDLWKNTPHTQDLKNLYLSDKTKLIIPVDIRSKFFSFSWEISSNQKEYGSILMSDYLKNFTDFLIYNKEVIPNYNNLLEQVIFDRRGITEYFNYIKFNYKILKSLFLLDKSLSFNLKYVKQLFYKLNDIANMIMEYYMMLLALTTEKESIIHSGLHHTTKFIKNIKKYYGFTEIYQNGVTDIDNINSDYSSCVEYSNE